jgi:hypothetical protein
MLLARRWVKGVIPIKDDQRSNERKKGSHGGREYSFDQELYERAMPWNSGSTASGGIGP